MGEDPERREGTQRLVGISGHNAGDRRAAPGLPFTGTETWGLSHVLPSTVKWGQ